MNKTQCLILIAFISVLLALSGCSKSTEAPPTPGQLPPQAAAQQQQTALEKETYQINNSNMSAQDKQRLLQQLNASTGH